MDLSGFLTERTLELTMGMTSEATARMAEWAQAQMREVRLTLPHPGDRWPVALKRHQAVDLKVGDVRVVGRVKRRRLGVLVIEGVVETERRNHDANGKD